MLGYVLFYITLTHDVGV